jgi:hypothetical protein
MKAIREKEETVLSRINEAFRMLKAVGEVEKKLQVVEREVKRMYLLSET